MGKMKEIATTIDELARLMDYHNQQYWLLMPDEQNAHVRHYHDHHAFEYECKWAELTRAYDTAADEYEATSWLDQPKEHEAYGP